MSETGADYVVRDTTRSSVELAVDSKGAVKPAVKVYVGTTAKELYDAVALAESAYDALHRKYVLGEVVP